MGQSSSLISKLFSYFSNKESELDAAFQQHKADCFELEYTEDEIKQAINELLHQGQKELSLDEIVNAIDRIQEKNELIKENQRLKSIVYCMICKVNDVSALFLPCTHNKLCMTCAEHYDKCPVCEKGIQEKIRTYMV